MTAVINPDLAKTDGDLTPGHPDPLQTDIEMPAGGVIVLHVSGELNTATDMQLDHEIHRVLEMAPFAIIMDMDVVPFLAWGGVAVLDDLRRECLRRGITLRWVSRSVSTSRMLHRAGMDRLCVIGDSLDLAVEECTRMQRFRRAGRVPA